MAKRYQCKCGFESSDKKEYNTHVHRGRYQDGKGIHGKAGKVTPTDKSELSEVDRIRAEVEADYKSRLAEAVAIINGGPKPRPQPADEPTKEEVAIFEKSAANLKAAVDQKCLVIRPRYSGGWSFEKLDTTRLDTSNCMWYRYGEHYPVFYEHENGNGKELIPVENFDQIGELPSMLFDAQNSASYKRVLKPKMNGLEKLRMGVMVVLVLGIFLLVYVMSSGQGGV